MSDPEFEKAVAEFVGAFEVVFRHDWSYTKFQSAHIEEAATFIEPRAEDEMDDWWARGVLLEKYRALLALMKAKKIKPQFSDELQRVMTVFKDRNR
jgi:hypothetical protein